MVDTSVFDKFSTRQMQVYAAICVSCFCRNYDISHKSIDEFINHLLSIAVNEDLADWESKGALLDIVGRGDPLPDDVVSVIPPECIEAFDVLVEYSVEVGIVDMYGAVTENPKIFLLKCISILEDCRVALPDIYAIEKYGHGSGSWGEVILNDQLDEIRVNYKLIK